MAKPSKWSEDNHWDVAMVVLPDSLCMIMVQSYSTINNQNLSTLIGSFNHQAAGVDHHS